MFRLTFRFNDNFDKSRLGVTTVDSFAGVLNTLVFESFD